MSLCTICSASLGHLWSLHLTVNTRMVQLPATAATEYVAAGHFLAGGAFVRGSFARGSFARGNFFPGALLPGGTFDRGDFWPEGFLSGRAFVRGSFARGTFSPAVFCPEALLAGGTFARGDFCPGGLCPFPQCQCVYAPSRLSVPSIVAWRTNRQTNKQKDKTRMVQLPATAAIEYVAAWNEN